MNAGASLDMNFNDHSDATIPWLSNWGELNVIVPLNLPHKPQALTKSFHEVVMCHEYFVNLRSMDTLYKVLRLMTTLDLAPNLAAFKAV